MHSSSLKNGQVITNQPSFSKLHKISSESYNKGVIGNSEPQLLITSPNLMSHKHPTSTKNMDLRSFTQMGAEQKALNIDTELGDLRPSLTAMDNHPYKLIPVSGRSSHRPAT